MGSRPALIVNEKKYHVENLTNTLVQVPWGVEAVWSMLTPKNVATSSKVQKIACCALYFKPNSNQQQKLLDHLSDAFNILSTKFTKGLHFIIAGDTNNLKLEKITSLSPNLVQIVHKWTRLSPPAMLDPVIMTLSNCYQEPDCLEPLDADIDKGGKPADHMIVVARPIDNVNYRCSRQIREVKTRPITSSGLLKMKDWLIDHAWDNIYNVESAHEKAQNFQNILLEKLEEFFPQKIHHPTSFCK